jgi:glucan biosynthesis protein
VSFRLDPGKEPAIELRGRLLAGEAPLSEVWVYRWTA